MTDYYNKYLKYKFKYILLQNGMISRKKKQSPIYFNNKTIKNDVDT